MDYRPVNFGQKFGLLREQWQPRVVAELNDYQFKVVRLEGDFVWHSHADTDEAFVVVEGELRIDFRDGAVRIGPGEMFVCPEGHRAQALCRARSEGAAHRAARRAEHRRSGRRAHRPERRLDLISRR
jgi:mannose-6-phosphate isomerase-like protein (cupin superfamily)